jgi:FkbM family methyltransferase
MLDIFFPLALLTPSRLIGILMFRLLLKRLLLRFGYELRKAYPEAYPGIGTIDVLELAVHELIARRGSNLTFLQIGANDGLIGDPIRRFILAFGWKGILVEPQPDVFERLKSNYSGSTQLRFENCAIADRSGYASFYTVREPGNQTAESSTFASFDRKRLENYARKRGATVEELSVPIMSPDCLLKKHEIDHIDLLQIDAEGHDFEILKLFALGSSGPPLIHFESGNLRPSIQEECYRYLAKRGYRLLTVGGDTLALQPESGGSNPGDDDVVAGTDEPTSKL